MAVWAGTRIMRWLQHSKCPDRAHKLWTDDYLAALAILLEAALTAFDQGCSTPHPALDVVPL